MIDNWLTGAAAPLAHSSNSHELQENYDITKTRRVKPKFLKQLINRENE